jgi:filamentous hemagglutinin family protein
MSTLRRAIRAALVAGLGIGSAQAQVVTDGTLGAVTNLAGPQFQIGEDLGRRVGDNLFHSFRQFDIATGQGATFLGAPSILNVIARVTGGQPSTINGAVRVSGPMAANLWLVNPSGLVFGSGASIDVPGAVYLSTATHLTLGNGSGAGRFDAVDPSRSVLVAAAPSAFGFGGANAASITLNGTRLVARSGQQVALVGGDVRLNDARIDAPSGRIQVGAVSSAGEARIGSDGVIDYTAFARLGEVYLSRGATNVAQLNANLNVSGTTAAAGSVLLRGGRLVSEAGAISAESRGSGAGGVVDLDFRERITTSGATLVSTVARGSGRAGDVSIRAPEVQLGGNTEVRTDSRGAGDGGRIVVAGGNVTLSGNARLNSFAFAGGNGGSITVTASENLLLRDAASIRAETDASGNAGSIALSGRNVRIQGDGTLQASTFRGSTGNGGAISITAQERFELVGDGQGQPRDSALISTAASGSGNGGDIRISAGSFVLDALALVESTANGAGDAGRIAITAGSALVTGGSAIDSRSTAAGDGGNIRLDVGSLVLEEGARLSAEALGTGFAGDIEIDTRAGRGDGSILIDRSRIATAAQVSDGGNIRLLTSGDIRLETGTIETSVRSGQGNGGNIALGDPANRPQFLIARDSRIEANAFGGNGGNIDVDAEYIVLSSTSVLRASSALGVDGTITFATPEVDLAALVPVVAAVPGSDSPISVAACRSSADRASRLHLSGGSVVARSQACDR